MAGNEGGPVAFDARGVATYLVSLRPVLRAATETRQLWVKRVGVLMADTRHGNRALIQQQAGQIGRDHGNQFRDVQRMLVHLRVPRECSTCHRELDHWLARLVQSCEVLAEIGRDGELTRLRETQRLLTEARAHAHSFNAEYARLCEVLRDHVRTASIRAKGRRADQPRARRAEK
jgi:hypothetical protein